MEMLNKLKRRFDRIKRNIPRFVLPVVICITLASFVQLSRDITLDQANILTDAVMLAATWMTVAWVLCRKKPTLTKYYVCLCGFFLFTAIFCVLYARTPNAPEHMLRANQKLMLTSIGGASAYAAVICIKLYQNRKLNKTRKSKKKSKEEKPMDYIYKLAFKPAADRADIVLTNAGGFIRTKTGPDIKTLDACDLFFRTHLMDKHGYDAGLVQNLAHRCTCVKLMDPERDGIDVSCVRNTLTIKFETASGRTYYAAFDGATDIMMLREDRNGNEEGRVDIITIPTNIYNKTCNDTAIKNLFRQIVEEYQEQYPNDIVFEADARPVWNQFVNIPEDFLAKYGVSIQPMEPAALIIVGMDEEIL